MLEWNPQSPDEEILFNDIVDGSPVGVRLDVHSGARQVYMRPFATACGSGARAGSVSLGRIERLHPGEGVAGVPDHHPDEAAPESDGLFVIGLSTGLDRMLVSVASVAALVCAGHPEMRRQHFWLEHPTFNPGGSRLLFTVSSGGAGVKSEGALYTIGVDGSDLREVVPFGRGATRGLWLDEGRGVATFRGEDDSLVPRVFTDGPPEEKPLSSGVSLGPVQAVPAPGGVLFAVESENSRRRSRNLSVFNRKSGETTTLGDFPVREDLHFHGPCRCDLSPRWNLKGSVICVDAIGVEGTRQLHLVPLAGKVSRPRR